MTLILKNVCIDKLVDIINEYNNMYHRIIKMKLIDVNSGSYINFGVENNEKDPWSWRPCKYIKTQKRFGKRLHLNWSWKVLMIEKVKNTALWTFVSNDLNFRSYNGSCVLVDNRKKDILILGEGPTQGLDDTTMTAEAKYTVNFTRSGRKFCLSLHYNGSNSFVFANSSKIYQFKAKYSVD